MKYAIAEYHTPEGVYSFRAYKMPVGIDPVAGPRETILHTFVGFDENPLAFFKGDRVRDIYNSLTDSKVKKFENRTIADARLTSAIVEHAFAYAPPEAETPKPEKKARAPKAEKAAKEAKPAKTPKAKAAKAPKAKKEKAAKEAKPGRKPVPEEIGDVLKAHGAFPASNRARLLTKLFENKGSQVPFLDLVEAVYGSSEKAFHGALRMSLRGALKNQEKNTLRLQIRKGADASNLSYGMYVTE